MTHDEIVRALKCCSRVDAQCNGCDGCPFEYCGPECDLLCKNAATLIESMQSQLAESQRRERAAVEDLEGAGACFTCKHFRRNGGDCFGAGRCRLDGIEIWPCNEPGVYRVEVPDDGRKMYEWRGPREDGKGEAG